MLQKHLGTRASDMYRTGPLGFLDVLLGAKSFDELSTTWDILKDLNKDDAESIGEMKVAKAEAAAAHKEFDGQGERCQEAEGRSWARGPRHTGA